MLADHNLFATVLTHAAPSSNYRGEGEENRTVIQRISRHGQEFAVVSPEAMRNALREQLALRGVPCNRSRLHEVPGEEKDQLAVEFKTHPDANTYADDFLFGYLVADKAAVRAMKGVGAPTKRDSVLRMNMAVALTPFRYDATFHQSPFNAKTPRNAGTYWKNTATSVLLHREVSYTAFQFPFALALRDCSADRAPNAPKWTRELLGAIAELSNVAGGHARSLYEMAPKSVVARLTRSLVAGYETYGFREDGSFAELARIGTDLPGDEFWLGGEIVRSLPEKDVTRLAAAGVHVDANPQTLLRRLTDHALGVPA